MLDALKVEFCVDFNSGLRNMNFLIAKKSIFGICKVMQIRLGDYMVDINS